MILTRNIFILFIIISAYSQIFPEISSSNSSLLTDIRLHRVFQKPGYQCGCLGLPLGQSTTVPLELPLQKILYDIQITNGAADIKLSQTYINQGNKFLQLQYRFPVSPNSCIHKFVAIFSNSRMEGKVKQRQVALLQYSQAVKLGQKAALGDVDQQSKDIFTLQIGNIAPGESVRIQISYTEELSLSLNTFYQFHLVTKNNPRYVNTIPSKDYLNSFRNTVKVVGGNFEWDFKLKVKAARKIISYKSLSHQLLLQSKNQQNTQISLTLQKGQPFSKAFSFIYTTKDFQLPSYSLGNSETGTSVMVSFIPKFAGLDLKKAEQLAIKEGSYVTEIESVKGEYVFILDRSGSMSVQPMQKAKEALILFLKSLPLDTYFQIVSFGSTYQKMFPKSLKSSKQTISSAIKKVEIMSSNMGGTQIYQPLQNILTSSIIQGYPKQIFLLTDGSVSNTQIVINLVAKNTKYSRVHAIGVGDGVSEALIIGCASKGKGQYVFIGNGENPSAKIIQLLSDSLTPVISKVSLIYDRQIVDSIIKNPDSLPFILKGQVANFFIIFKGKLTRPTSISLSYTDSQNNLPYKSEITINPQQHAEIFVDKLANYQRIKALQQAEATQLNIQNYLYCQDPAFKIKPLKQLITELSVKHQIISKYTAFICVETYLQDGIFKEKNKGRQKIQVVQVNGYIAQASQSSTMLNPAYAKASSVYSPSNSTISPSIASRASISSSVSSRSALPFISFSSSTTAASPPVPASSTPSAPSAMTSSKMLSNPSTKPSSNLNSNGKQQATNMDIKQVVSLQYFQGFWDDQLIIQNIYGKDTINLIKGKIDKIAIITYLVVIWIEKYYPQPQYSLIIKKAKNWLNKQPNSGTYSIYDSYLK